MDEKVEPVPDWRDTLLEATKKAAETTVDELAAPSQPPVALVSRKRKRSPEAEEESRTEKKGKTVPIESLASGDTTMTGCLEKELARLSSIAIIGVEAYSGILQSKVEVKESSASPKSHTLRTVWNYIYHANLHLLSLTPSLTLTPATHLGAPMTTPTDLEVWHSCVFTLAGTSRNLEDIGGSHILLEEDEEWAPDLPVNYGEGLWHDEVHEPTPGWREMVAGYNRAPDDEGLAASEAVGATETAPEVSSDVPHSDGGEGEAETWHLQWLLERLEIEEAVGCEAKEDVDIFEGSMESTTTPEDDSTGSNMSDESDVNEGAETDNNGTIEERSEPADNTPPRFGTPVELNDVEDLRELLTQHDAALGFDHRRLDPARQRGWPR